MQYPQFKGLYKLDVRHAKTKNLFMKFYTQTLFPQLYELKFLSRMRRVEKRLIEAMRFDNLRAVSAQGIYSWEDWPKCQFCKVRPVIPQIGRDDKYWCPDAECVKKRLDHTNPMKRDPQGTLKKIQKTMQERYGEEVTNANDLDYVREIKRQKQLQVWKDKRYRMKRANSIFEKHGAFNVKQNKEAVQELIQLANLGKPDYETFMQYVYETYSKYKEVELLDPSNFDDFLMKQGDENRSYLYKCKRCGLKFKRYTAPVYDALFWTKTKSCPIMCPKCDVSKSKYENEIVSVITEQIKSSEKLIVNRNDHKILHPNEIDIVVRKPNSTQILGIEYDGIFYHSTQHLRTFSKNYEEFEQKSLRFRKNLEIKYKKAYNHPNLQLIVIDEISWENNKDFWESKLKLLLGDTSGIERIYARDTKIELIDSKTANTFIAKYHIHSIRPGSYYLGLFLNQELLGVMVLGKTSSRKIMDDRPISEFELYRLAFKPYVQIIGGLSKLLSFASEQLGINMIQTYVDLSLGFKPDMWVNSGFRFVNLSPVTYKILDNQTGEVKHRIYIRKLLSPGQSELEFIWNNPRYDIWYRPGTVKLIWEK